MKSMIRQGVRSLVGVAVGGATLNAVGSSNMAPGFKEATQVAVSAGVLRNVAPGAFKSVKTHKLGRGY